ncbi:MAG: hydroxyacid dehydrogenase, partial [Patescibacteria group bacterium]|nr:hydroxyacid dehydrogenase [Patescibacteria group bacterium]
WEIDYFKQKLAGQELIFLADKQLPPQDAEILCNFVGSPARADLIGQLPKLKLIATRSTGFDHIDLKICAQRGIMVSNVPTYGENTVAEFTFALILALSRKLYPAIKQVREQGLFATDRLEGFDLQGKTLGIVGTGHIGEHVARMARGFNMNIVAFDPHPKAELTQQYGVEYAPLEGLLQKADIVSLHVPYMPATHHLLNASNIGLCKKGAIIINTARGGLVETAALVAALKSGQIAGAGLDVLEEEGFVKDELEMLTAGHPNEDQLKTALADHDLMQMDNVLVTPHTAFNTREALLRILDTTAANIQNFIAGKPTNLVKLQFDS